MKKIVSLCLTLVILLSMGFHQINVQGTIINPYTGDDWVISRAETIDGLNIEIAGSIILNSTFKVTISNSNITLHGDFNIQNAAHLLVNNKITFVDQGRINILYDGIQMINSSIIGVGNHGLFIIDSSNVIIRGGTMSMGGDGSYGIHLDGSSAEIGDMIINVGGTHGISAQRADNVLIYNVSLTAGAFTDSHAISFENTNNVNIINSSVTAFNARSLSMININNITISNSVLTSRDDQAVFMEGGYNISFYDNVMEGPSDWKIKNIENLQMINNTLDTRIFISLTNVYNSSFVKNTGSSVYGMFNILDSASINFTSNQFDTSNYGFAVSNVTSMSFNNNNITAILDPFMAVGLYNSTIYNNTINGQNGIELRLITNVDIINSTISADGEAILISDASNVSLSHSSVSSTNANAIILENSNTIMITSNNVQALGTAMSFSEVIDTSVINNILSGNIGLQMSKISGVTIDDNFIYADTGIKFSHNNWSPALSLVRNNTLMVDSYGIYTSYQAGSLDFINNTIVSDYIGLYSSSAGYDLNFIENIITANKQSLMLNGHTGNFLHRAFFYQNRLHSIQTEAILLFGEYIHFLNNSILSDTGLSLSFLGGKRNIFENNLYNGQVVGIETFSLNFPENQNIGENISVIKSKDSIDIYYQWEGHSKTLLTSSLIIYYPGDISLAVWYTDDQSNIYKISKGLKVIPESAKPIITLLNESLVVEEFEETVFIWNIDEIAISNYSISLNNSLVETGIGNDQTIIFILNLVVGHYNLSLTVFDTSGNNETFFFEFDTLDTTAPTVKLVKEEFIFYEDQRHFITGSIIENNPSYFEMYLDNDYQGRNEWTGSNSNSIDFSYDFEGLPRGLYQVKIIFYDIFNNSLIVNVLLNITMTYGEYVSLTRIPITIPDVISETEDANWSFLIFDLFVALIIINRFKKPSSKFSKKY